MVGAITAAAHVVPAMARRGSGSFIVTGGMPEPKPDYVSLSLGKAGVRTLVALLDKQYGPSGVHVATVTVAGPVAPGAAFDPDDIAEHYWRLHTQPPHRWDWKYRPDGTAVDSPRAEGARAYLDQGGAAVLTALDEIATVHGTTVAAVALAWLLAHPRVAAPIVSARTTEQLEQILPATTLALTPAEIARL